MGVLDRDRRCPLRPLTRWSTDPSLKPTFKNKSFGKKAEAFFDRLNQVLATPPGHSQNPIALEPITTAGQVNLGGRSANTCQELRCVSRDHYFFNRCTNRLELHLTRRSILYSVNFPIPLLSN
ncbi:hypothetical protein EI555_010662 [Monodon monoceros]|uniref:Uncharacterized protein n=1 Tax=Monodon monoceros TaxID=40151 RepID=A0A4U1EUM3_MONMO|nr:hypothetical protein EI555_010662 [Monodon monoceros]